MIIRENTTSEIKRHLEFWKASNCASNIAKFELEKRKETRK
jgi:hypothetical protein